MSEPDNEGESFVNAFGSMFGAVNRTEERLKAERRASMTSKQRARKPTKTEQVNFRCTPELKELLERLAKQSNASIAKIIEEAVGELAAQRGGGRAS